MGEYTLQLVGESNYQPAVRKLVAGEVVNLEAEPTNSFDPRAIKAVSRFGDTLGYAPRDSWLQGVLLDQQTDIYARVDRVIGNEAGKPSVGVVLTVWTAREAVAARAVGIIGAGGASGGAMAATAPDWMHHKQQPSRWGWWFAIIVLLLLAIGTCSTKPKPATVGNVVPIETVTDAPLAEPDAARAAPDAGGANVPEPASQTAFAFSAGYVETSIKLDCSATYPADLAMRAACGRNHRSGLASWREIRAQHAHDSEMLAALDQCAADYTVGETTDFAIMGGCARNQERGWEDTR